MIRRFGGFMLAATVLLSSALAFAQGYPNKAIRIVVPFAPGGNVDINARAMASGMSDLFGQTVVVDTIGSSSAEFAAYIKDDTAAASRDPCSRPPHNAGWARPLSVRKAW